MKPPDREKAQERIREWATLTPEQRRLARNNYRLAKSLDKEEREASWEQYSSMTDEQRSVLQGQRLDQQHRGAPRRRAHRPGQGGRPAPAGRDPADGEPTPAGSRSQHAQVSSR